MSEKENLFSLVIQANAITQALAESNGELTPALEALMDHVDIALPEKIDSYHFVMERMEEEAKFWKAKADMYSKLAKSHTAIQDRIKDRLKAAMITMGVDEIKGNSFRFKLSNVQPKLVIDEAKLDKTYFMTVTEVIPDKERIKESLKLGATIEGAELQESKSLRPYVNKGAKS